MAPGTGASPASPAGRRTVLAAVVVVLLFGGIAGGLVALVASRPPTGAASPAPSSYAVADVATAPDLQLTDQDGRAFTLGAPGRPTLVFFGYTHCPDVCPATVGVITQAVLDAGAGPQALFVSIDPERDDVAAMKAYTRFLPAWLVGLTGSPAAIAENAARWGVKYARIEEGTPPAYGMAHTADVFLVDAAGRLRARFPFGTEPGPIASVLRTLLAETPVAAASPRATVPASASLTPNPTSTPTAAPSIATPPPAAELVPELVSTSVWAGEPDPVILRVTDAAGSPLDASVPVRVQLARFDGSPEGAAVAASALAPEGETRPSYVATMTIPSPGAWRLLVTAGDATGDVAVQALDPGVTSRIGGPAPDVDTPTLDDVGGVVRAVTTEPAPDLRLSTTSTADARAAGRPYVLVVDSARFKVSPACGRALSMIEVLVDRWPGVAFIHLEPFEYSVITDEPVLAGPLTDPPLNRWASAFGLGAAPWPATEMPWIFVVDGSGSIRAKYTGIVGTADIDVILTQLAAEAAR
jgi:protein SCO1/2